MKTNQKKGFTLAELLTVVAIIAVLVAVAIPVFSSSLEKAKSGVCIANRTAAQHAITIEQITTGKKLTQAEAEAKAVDAVGVIASICPDGGPCRVAQNADGTWSVLCSIHADSAVQTMQNNVTALFDPTTTLGGTKLDLLNVGEVTVTDYIKGYFNRSSFSNSLDSTGGNFGAPLKQKLAETLGITNDFDFKVYKTSRTAKEYEIYIFDPIAAKKAGETVVATGYKFQEVSGQLILDPSTGVGSAMPVGIQTNSSSGKKINVINRNDYVW